MSIRGKVKEYRLPRDFQRDIWEIGASAWKAFRDIARKVREDVKVLMAHPVGAIGFPNQMSGCFLPFPSAFGAVFASPGSVVLDY